MPADTDMAIIKVVRYRRGPVEFWIPDGVEGRILQLVRDPELTDQEYWEMLAARQRAFDGLFAIIGE
jgi:hypothetical protein